MGCWEFPCILQGLLLSCAGLWHLVVPWVAWSDPVWPSNLRASRLLRMQELCCEIRLPPGFMLFFLTQDLLCLLVPSPFPMQAFLPLIYIYLLYIYTYIYLIYIWNKSTPKCFLLETDIQCMCGSMIHICFSRCAEDSGVVSGSHHRTTDSSIDFS